MSNRNAIKFSKNEVITAGRTYKMNNGWTARVNSIWCDKYGDNVRYTVVEDGKCGDTTPNTFYYWVDWAASNAVAA